MHSSHKEILDQIKSHAGIAGKHLVSETYLGNSHPRYPISMPDLRLLCRTWMKENKHLKSQELVEILDSIVEGDSFTEKCVAGILLDYATPEQRNFNIKNFDRWLDHLEGWAEIDTLCTGKYSLLEVPGNLSAWHAQLERWSKSKNIGKRRASLVFLCSPISHSGVNDIGDMALDLISRLMHEREILITKAVSWLLRSMIRHHREKVAMFVEEIEVRSLLSRYVKRSRSLRRE